MPSHSAMLDAIQKAGAAVFDADVQLKLSVKAYAERVHAAVGANPYHLGNDALFENWKLVARLAQTMTGMEEELRKVYQVAAELSDDGPSLVTAMPTLSAPDHASPAATDEQKGLLAPTDVKVKKSKSLSARKSTPTPPESALKQPTSLPGNAAALLRHLGTVLNVRKFTAINQTAISAATGIPLGSMTASLKRLVTDGHVVQGPDGRYKIG